MLRFSVSLNVKNSSIFVTLFLWLNWNVLFLMIAFSGGWSQRFNVSHDNVDGSAWDGVPPREHRQTGLALFTKTESSLTLLQRDCPATTEKGELLLLRIGTQDAKIVVSLR